MFFFLSHEAYAMDDLSLAIHTQLFPWNSKGNIKVSALKKSTSKQ